MTHCAGARQAGRSVGARMERERELERPIQKVSMLQVRGWVARFPSMESRTGTFERDEAVTFSYLPVCQPLLILTHPYSPEECSAPRTHCAPPTSPHAPEGPGQ